MIAAISLAGIDYDQRCSAIGGSVRPKDQARLLPSSRGRPDLNPDGGLTAKPPPPARLPKSRGAPQRRPGSPSFSHLETLPLFLLLVGRGKHSSIRRRLWSVRF